MVVKLLIGGLIGILLHPFVTIAIDKIGYKIRVRSMHKHYERQGLEMPTWMQDKEKKGR